MLMHSIFPNDGQIGKAKTMVEYKRELDEQSPLQKNSGLWELQKPLTVLSTASESWSQNVLTRTTADDKGDCLLEASINIVRE